MPFYRVRWEIDIDADSPKEAARRAWQIQRDPQSEATIFDVAPTDGNDHMTGEFESFDPVEDMFNEDDGPVIVAV